MTASLKPKNKRPRIFDTDDPDAFQEEFCLRMIASAAGLPRICTLRICRRRRRCFGTYRSGLPCVRHHGQLCGERLGAALQHLGWPCDEAGDDVK